VRSSPNPLLMNVLHVAMCFPESAGLGDSSIFLGLKLYWVVLKNTAKSYSGFAGLTGGYNEKTQAG